MASSESSAAGALAGVHLRPPALPHVGLALAGGASEGAIYEIGALRALDEAIASHELGELGFFVGVSAGGFLSACLANGLSTAQMCRAIVKHEPGEHPFVPEIFFQPAVKEIATRLISTPRWLGSALWSYVTGREKRLLDALTVLARTLPVGVFDNDAVREYVHKIFSIKGRSDDFRKLHRHLAVVATDLESGESVRFGQPGWRHMPISKAVQATTALPGLYPPVEIDGRFYVDGILRKTMHASVALELGAKLVFCINPIVPIDTRPAVQRDLIKPGQLMRRGLASVMSQSVRAMIYSRMELGVRAYKTRYPDADVVLIEPARDDYENFFSNIFSFAARRAVCERAYHATRESLRQRRSELEPLFSKHGLVLDVDFLEDAEHDLWVSVDLPEASRQKAKPAAKAAKGKDEAPFEDPQDVLTDLSGLLDKVERWVATRR